MERTRSGETWRKKKEKLNMNNKKKHTKIKHMYNKINKNRKWPGYVTRRAHRKQNPRDCMRRRARTLKCLVWPNTFLKGIYFIGKCKNRGWTFWKLAYIKDARMEILFISYILACTGMRRKQQVLCSKVAWWKAGRLVLSKNSGKSTKRSSMAEELEKLMIVC